VERARPVQWRLWLSWKRPMTGRGWSVACERCSNIKLASGPYECLHWHRRMSSLFEHHPRPRRSGWKPSPILQIGTCCCEQVCILCPRTPNCAAQLPGTCRRAVDTLMLVYQRLCDEQFLTARKSDASKGEPPSMTLWFAPLDVEAP
jgi:hypothetical protein